MATSSNTPNSPEDSVNYTKMSVGEVEAIGAHCQAPFCHQLDFLPFLCQSCRGKFCLDHRTEDGHNCPKAGEWARLRAESQRTAYKPTPKPNLLTHEQQCSHTACKTLINTPLVTGVLCEKCNRSYCLKHRFTYDHDCANLTPLGARAGAAQQQQQTQKEKGAAALAKLKAWGAAKKASMPKAPQSRSKVEAAARAAELAELKKGAKGDEKVAVEKRVYLYVEASSDTVTSKIPKGTFFYSVDLSIGRMLDLAAKSLQVSNVNNRSEGEEDKLRVFHVEGGRLLEFAEKVGSCGLATGNTIVLLRGVGAAMAKTPEKTT